jgi:LPXTG-site transpeptidase (sortase) family protein
MSKLDKEAISVFSICIIVLAILYTLVAIRFFTNDNNKDTISQNSNVNSEQETPSIAKIEEVSAISQEELIKEKNLPEEKENTQEKREITNVSSRSKQTVEQPSPQVVSSPKVTEKPAAKPQTQPVAQSTNSKPVTQTLPSIGTIKIPKTNVNMKILEKVSVSGMETNACFLYSTGSLNIDGNTVIVGHNYRNGKLFSNNNKLQIGDNIYITTLDGKTVIYTIYSKFTTTPEDVSFYRRDTNGK